MCGEPISLVNGQTNMLIKTYKVPSIVGEQSAQCVLNSLQKLPVQGIDIDHENHTVKVGLLEEGDDELVKSCLTECGFAPEEVLLEPRG